MQHSYNQNIRFYRIKCVQLVENKFRTTKYECTSIIVCLFVCLVFNGTFSTYRLYRATGV